MKKDIHPQFNEKATIACACGASYTVGSTTDNVAIELCANCHPFYTGKQKVVDSARRLEKFQARAEQKGNALDHKAKAVKRAERAAKKAKKREEAENA